MQNKVVDYLSSQLHCEQWAFFLEALSDELLHQISTQDMRMLARNAGLRAGRAMPLPACDSLDKLEAAANEHWAKLGWGLVTFEEQSGHLMVEHMLAPLKATLGAESMKWAAGFLEGVYQEWFLLLGAGNELQVTQVGPVDEYGGLKYRLGR
ncbi:cellulose synthase [Pusillimonas sp. MFBS29]|uniref:cellulose biosynthesis protein BcsD n=1 Tax=Pusillimonas sp. MFBS29 TaxID=2886690 RepID=UPI001D0F7483|nr:cellulose biosynthesis protein BcsD [Pusillimonas sp. MFBS29]MCC2596007.1 cellulose synthase [Pusillimonas sp. MFBS29]